MKQILAMCLLSVMSSEEFEMGLISNLEIQITS